VRRDPGRPRDTTAAARQGQRNGTRELEFHATPNRRCACPTSRIGRHVEPAAPAGVHRTHRWCLPRRTGGRPHAARAGLLQRTDQAVTTVARRVGYRDEGTSRRPFAVTSACRRADCDDSRWNPVERTRQRLVDWTARRCLTLRFEIRSGADPARRCPAAAICRSEDVRFSARSGDASAYAPRAENQCRWLRRLQFRASVRHRCRAKRRAHARADSYTTVGQGCRSGRHTYTV
jgi:hypothetical protein